MHTLTLEYATEKERAKAVKHLWDKMKISGEMHLYTLGGRFRMEVVSEKSLRTDTLAKLGGVPVDPGGGDN